MAKLHKEEIEVALGLIIKIPPSPLVLLQFGDGFGCNCDALNGTLVTSPADSEEAVLTPVGAPAVLDNPVLLSSHVASAIPHQQHSVIGQLEGVVRVSEASVVVDALLVVHEVRVDLWKDGDNSLLI